MRTRGAVMYPPFLHSWPAVDVARTAAVLMVNPIPAKDAGLLPQLIRLMLEQRFTLVEGWWDTAADFAAHPNVTYLPRVYDTASLYRSHRALLVPSAVGEAFPCVIVKAALHGVPSIGTDRGGILEAIGAWQVGAWKHVVRVQSGLRKL
ncbi:glycosyltransferase [Streptomyces sp. NPDC006367]|uniref:glycosyltransferase n=1 Tax=unclassified Streptomyces TaxID=2593676 RepID=UPI0033A5DF0F